jgi:hypothetical protein
VDLVPNGVADASRDPAKIEDWYSKHPDAGVAIRLDHRVVIDVARGADASLRALESRLGSLPTTAGQTSASGGVHLLYQRPFGPELDGAIEVEDGLRVLSGESAYLVVSPSTNGAGQYKGFGKGSAELPDAWVRELATQFAAAETSSHSPTTPLVAASGESSLRLVVVTARDLCTRGDPPGAQQLVGPIVLRGCRTVVGGQTGQGKTTFALGLVAAYVNKSDFLGWTGSGGRALVIDLEQGEMTIKKRLREAGLEDSDQVDLALVPDGVRLDSDAEQRAEFERVFAEGGYGLVLLDPYYKAHGGDANNEREVMALMLQLDRWRSAYEFALILPTHGRKPSPTNSGRPTIHDIAAGSGAIVRGAEVVVGVEIEKPGVTRLYAFKHRDGDDELPLHRDPWKLTFSRDAGYQRLDTSTGERKASSEEIADWIRDDQGGRAKPGKIRAHFQIAESTLRDRRERLQELGIHYHGNGKHAEYFDPTVHPAIHPASRRGVVANAGSEPLVQAESTPR